MKKINKIINYAVYFLVFLLPWQTRWIYHDAFLVGETWEYGRLSLYGTEILLILILVLALINYFINKNKIEKVELKNNCLWMIVLVFVLWTVLSIVWASNKLLAWSGCLMIFEGAGIFWLINNQTSKVNLKKLSQALILSGVVQSLLGIWQFIIQWFWSNKWLGLSLLNPAVSGVSVVESGWGRFLRAYGSLSHPNILAGFLVVCLLVCIILLIYEKTKNVAKWYYYALIILSVGLFLTFSRAGWLTLFGCLIIYGWSKKVRQIKQNSFLVASVWIVLIFIFLSIVNSSLFLSRITGQQRLERLSNQQRLNQYREATGMINNNWLTGIGIRNYTFQLYNQNQNLSAWDYQPIHNVFVLVWAETGIIGLIIFILLIAKGLLRSNEFWIVFLAMLILGLFDHYAWSLFFGIMLWWLTLALVVNRQKFSTG